MSESPFADHPAKGAKGWPDPLQLMEIKDLVHKRAKRGFVGDREFTIRYEGTKFFIMPVKGIAPCGWFDLRTAFIEIE
jgi:hypothetical protein